LIIDRQTSKCHAIDLSASISADAGRPLTESCPSFRQRTTVLRRHAAFRAAFRALFRVAGRNGAVVELAAVPSAS
jgi:hypothetical protein